jgi:hypothetical protein
MVYKGDWDASGGTFPGSGSAQTGWLYYVSVGGTVGGVEFSVGDNIVATTDDASTSVYAGNWSKHDQTDAVQSVAGLTGSISASALRTAINVADGADVTNATTVEAAGAVMDSEVTNLAAVKAFDPADYATAAQGATADSALQSGDNVSVLANDAGYLTTVTSLRGVDLDSTVSTPSDGDILVYRSAGSDWVLEAKPVGSNPAINDITDVTITAPADNEVLAYDNGSGDWINQTASEAGLATAAQGTKADSALQPDTADTLSAAFTADVDDDGTQSSGTYTPSLSAGSQYKKIVNGGAFTLAPPSLDSDEATTINVFITNNASAGAITTSGFTAVSGDDFSTTDGDDFICAITVFDIGGTEYSLLDVRALQ